MHTDVLTLFQKSMAAFNVSVTYLESSTHLSELDFGLRKQLYHETTFLQEFSVLLGSCQPFTLYFIEDTFATNYVLCHVPSEYYPIEHILVGPYLTKNISETACKKLELQLQIPASFHQTFLEYFHAVPLIKNPVSFLSLIELQLSYLIGFEQAVPSISLTLSAQQIPLLSKTFSSPLLLEPEWTKANIISERYQKENEFLQAVSNGDFESAKKSALAFQQFRLKPRVHNPIRNARNFLLTLNTLLRKSMELANVSPIYIDQISEKWGIKIETVSSEAERDKYCYQMIRQYCLLAKNYSLTGYSPVIAATIQYIDLHIADKLSLQILAKNSQINASYLSRQFKEETKTTLTEYILERRIKRAILLLNSTNYNISTIAAEVGIEDANYFSKLFYKQVGSTPRDYRKKLMNGL